MMGQLQERRVKGTRHGWFSRGAVEVERSEYNIFFFFTHTEIASNLCVAGILTQLLYTMYVISLNRLTNQKTKRLEETGPRMRCWKKE